MRIDPEDTGFRVFSFLSLHEDQKYTLSQLASIVGRSERVTWAALNRLHNDALVNVEGKPAGAGWGRLYSASVGHPIFPELRIIGIKMLGGADALREVLLGNHAVEAAAIFGSVAAGTDRRSGRLSDIDLLVVFAEDSTRADRLAVRAGISAVSELLNREINIEGLLRSEWETGRQNDRILRRIAAGDLLPLKGDVNAAPRPEGPEDASVPPDDVRDARSRVRSRRDQ